MSTSSKLWKLSVVLGTPKRAGFRNLGQTLYFGGLYPLILLFGQLWVNSSVCVCVRVRGHAQWLGHVWLFVTAWTVASKSLCQWKFSVKNTGGSCCFLLQGSFQPRDWTWVSCVSCIGRWILYYYTTWEDLNSYTKWLTVIMKTFCASPIYPVPPIISANHWYFYCLYSFAFDNIVCLE